MKPFNSLQVAQVAGSLAVALALFSSATTARAYVYATDIQINGNLTNTSAYQSFPVSITYRLNQAADRGVTVNILQGSTVVKTITGGTNQGLNSVSWTPTSTGTYSVNITAAATGFPIWTQISATNAGNYMYETTGMAVDNNTNSPYYGRVVVSCAASGGINPISGATNMDGIYKLNADGSYADEGGFGYGGYSTDDAGDVSSPGQMPVSQYNQVPYALRIGDDDRIYMLDDSVDGAIIAFDMKVTTNQIVIDDGYLGQLGGPHNYTNNPDLGEIVNGIGSFDVTSTTTANAAIWLCDSVLDYPNWGIWMYHLRNGASDPADTVGTQAVIAGPGSDLNEDSGGGCMVDTNLDIFVSQSQYDNDASPRTMEYTNWNHGVLPPEADSSTNALGTNTGEVRWEVGTNDPTFEYVQDTVVNNRQHPTMVALPMLTGNNGYSGIRVLNATNGSVITATNGATVQVLTNLGYPNQYVGAAWDNVGNLYGAGFSSDFWRVWSPPGTNQATTLAVAQVTVSIPFAITGITPSPTTPGCSAVTISFIAPGNLPASAFTLIGSTTVNGTYTAVDASITGDSGSYQATVTSCSTMFYLIEEHPLAFAITGITASPTTPGGSAVPINIYFTAPVNPLLSSFTLLGSTNVNGPYTNVSAYITGGSGSYQAAATNYSTMFYLIKE
ncbi:MAG: hypothetical protein ACLQU4_09390 [Limisphaerales bacterium]